MAVDSMMQFRLSYLRLVAFAWESPANYAALTTAADPYTFFTMFGLPRPDWTIALELAAPTTKLAASRFDPANTGGWIGPKAELSIDFPAAPANPNDWAAAMTAYYARLPTPFGDPVPPAPGSGVSSGAGGHGMGHMSDAFVLGAVIIRALALSWSDAAFRSELFPNPPNPTRPINGALEDYFGYRLPWNMELLAKDDGRSFLPAVGGVGLGNFDQDPVNKIKMFVPQPPPGAPNKAIALAAYNQTGDQYPLTCP